MKIKNVWNHHLVIVLSKDLGTPPKFNSEFTPEKWWLEVGRWSFSFGMVYFQGRTVKLREGMIWACLFLVIFKKYTFVIQVASTFGMQCLISLSVGIFKRRIILLMFLERYSLYQEYYVLLQAYVQTYVFLHYKQEIGFLIIVWNSFNCMKCSWVFYISAWPFELKRK